MTRRIDRVTAGEIAVDDLLRRVAEAGASDLHLTAGAPPTVRIDGHLRALDTRRLTAADTEALFRQLGGQEHARALAERGQVDFSYSLAGVSRFRVNAFRQRGSLALALRAIPGAVPSLDELGLPPVLGELALRPSGLILVTGPAGSGRSTTLAAMIRHINENRAAHIITVEDPIEYLHPHQRGLVNQREVGHDATSFADGLRAALRQDPDVIMVGELPDLETTATALAAAEAGRLVLAALRTAGVPQAVERVVDVFPPHQQQQARVQLAATLQGVVTQQLVPRADRPGRVAAVEIMVATPAARNLIREGRTHQLMSVIQTGARHGMVTMERSLHELYERRVISEAEYRERVAGLQAVPYGGAAGR